MTKEEFEETFKEDIYIFDKVLNPNNSTIETRNTYYDTDIWMLERQDIMSVHENRISFWKFTDGKDNFIIPNNKYVSWIIKKYRGYDFAPFKIMYFNGQQSIKSYFQKYSLEEIDKRVEQMNFYKNNLIEIERVSKEKLYPESYKLIKKIQEKIPKKSEIKPV